MAVLIDNPIHQHWRQPPVPDGASHPSRRVGHVADRPPRLGSLRVRIELGLAAFAPAFGLLALRSRDSCWAWVFLAVALLGAVVLLVGALIVRRGNAEPFEFGDIDDLSGEILGHIGAYLVPAFVSTSGSTEEIITSAVILALIVQIHVATGRVYVNPLLYIFGYRVYSARVDAGTYYLIARTDVAAWTSHRSCVQIGSGVLVERSGKESN